MDDRATQRHLKRLRISTIKMFIRRHAGREVQTEELASLERLSAKTALLLAHAIGDRYLPENVDTSNRVSPDQLAALAEEVRVLNEEDK